MSDAALHRPPADITPQAFFESWLPKEYERLDALRQEQSLPAPPSVRVNIALEGEGGGTWTVSIADSKLVVEQGACESPDLGISQAVEDWRAIVTGDGGADDLVPPETSTADVLFAGTQIHESLQEVTGTIRFELQGFQGRTWAADVAFGGAEEPRATMALDAETYAQIRNKTLPAPQAYFSGKIQISGDTNLAMQVGMALMAKMS
jgi:hypothetical protein